MKPVTFYLHYVDPPSSVGGLQTKYVMDTLREFRYTTNNQALSGSLFKPVGQPKLSFSFYLAPGLLSPLKVDGDWSLSIWSNSTAYKPASFDVEYREMSSTGTVLWDSGQLSPSIYSSIGSYVDVPVNNYVLTSRLTHTFQTGSTIQATVNINAGSSSAIRVWFDSAFFPSKLTIPVADYARPRSGKLLAFDGRVTDLFDGSWIGEQRTISVRVNVSDPFGTYDVNSVSMRILYNGSVPVSDVVRMMPEPSGPRAFAQVYKATWGYPSSVRLGNYTVKVEVVDNTGGYRIVDEGKADPNIETLLHTFEIGPVKYYNPVLQVLDRVGDPVREAQVYITDPSAVRDLLPRYTNDAGILTLRHVLPGDYSIVVLWRDRVVNQTVIRVESDGPFIVAAQVFELKATVVDKDGGSVAGAEVLVNARNGLIYGFNTTSSTGISEIKLPPGNYNVTTRFSGVYWLSKVSATDSKSVSLTNNTEVKLVLNDYPPAIWTTNGFILVVAAVTELVLIALLFWISRRKRSKIAANS